MADWAGTSLMLLSHWYQKFASSNETPIIPANNFAKGRITRSCTSASLNMPSSLLLCSIAAFPSVNHVYTWTSWIDLAIIADNLSGFTGQAIDLSQSSTLLVDILDESERIKKCLKVLGNRHNNIEVTSRDSEWVYGNMVIKLLNTWYSVHVGDVLG
ncbi:hypothetical protein DAEQUDRAFT_808298 [Daedalea quercina L-15889]|uniref:Uncharacterized protein n=1 Tax=Daedalea quercina L-15889 TaxID=1314783 RepID=A0A165TMF4_9APHY|nr:hypothetical protein DAEQUDRAFT_808298 [Daedalea quercina L-15889]